MPKKIRTAIIPAAGLGTRFLPATKAVPKELIPILDKPAIQYIVEECVRAGIEKIVFVISKGKESIPKYFKKSPELDRLLKKKGRIESVMQLNDLAKKVRFGVAYQNKPKGLGDAVLKAKPLVKNEPFAVILPDDIIVSVTPAIGQLMEIYERRNCPVVSLEKVPMEFVSSYGVVAGTKVDDRLYHISDIVEKPKLEDAPSDLIIVGRYILPYEIFEMLETIKPAKNGEYQLTDALSMLMKEREFLGFEFFGDKYDVGSKAGFVKANMTFALKDIKLKDMVIEGVKRCL